MSSPLRVTLKVKSGYTSERLVLTFTLNLHLFRNGSKKEVCGYAAEPGKHKYRMFPLSTHISPKNNQVRDGALMDTQGCSNSSETHGSRPTAQLHSASGSRGMVSVVHTLHTAGLRMQLIEVSSEAFKGGHLYSVNKLLILPLTENQSTRTESYS